MNHFTRLMDGALPHVVHTYLSPPPEPPSLRPTSSSDDLNGLLDAYFNDCLTQGQVSPAVRREVAPVSLAEEILTSDSLEMNIVSPSAIAGSNAMAACFESFQNDMLHVSFAASFDEEEAVVTRKAVRPEVIPVTTTAIAPTVEAEASNDTASASFKPLKRMNEKCVYDGRLTVTVDCENKIAHMRFAFSVHQGK
jgi:hypothetical protein